MDFGLETTSNGGKEGAGRVWGVYGSEI